MNGKTLWESLTAEEQAKVNAAFDKGCKIDVVNALRDQKGWGLKDAKDTTDYASKLRVKNK